MTEEKKGNAERVNMSSEKDRTAEEKKLKKKEGLFTKKLISRAFLVVYYIYPKKKKTI